MLHCCFVLTQHDKQLAKAVGKLFGKLCIMDGFHLSKRAILKNNNQCSILKLKTRDAFPAAKTRKEGFRKVFNVWSKSHFSNFGVGWRTFPWSQKCLSVVHKIFKICEKHCVQVFPSEPTKLLAAQSTAYALRNRKWKKKFCKRNLGLQNPWNIWMNFFFPNNNFSLHNCEVSRSSHPEVFCKKGVLKNFESESLF